MLSRRHREYLELLARYPSETDRRLARRMGCSYSTYCKHAAEAKRRIGAKCKTDAVVKYLKWEIENP